MPNLPTAVALSPALVLTIAALGGAATMVVELAAVRLLAPWFGTSQAVWTNVIGVVLLALSLGYLVGARVSQRERPARPLSALLLGAGALAVWQPFLVPWVSRAMLPAELALDQAAGLLRWGSLATALVAFAPPALLLGGVAPLCAEILDRHAHRGAGSSGGRVLCVSTLGSLAGTFSTSLFLVPELGLLRTFTAAGGVLIVLGLVVALAARSRAPSALLLLALPTLLLGEPGAPELPEGARLLASRESAYQSVRVVSYAQGTAEERRELQVNEATDSFQSLWVPRPGLVGSGAYYDVFALPPWWGEAPGRWSVVVLGLGAGTALRVLDGTLPEGVQLAAVGVELDPAVVDLGRAWMELVEGPDRVVHSGLDARAALALAARTYDQIILDAYSNQIEIPAHLCTREFFALARARLAPGGYLCVNVGAFGLDDPVLVAVANSAAHGLEGPVLALGVPFSRNVVLFGRRDAVLPDPASPAFAPAPEALARLARALALPGAWRRFEPRTDGPILTDDRCDIERLQLASIDRARLDGAEAGR